jgi:hypothetical protein
MNERELRRAAVDLNQAIMLVGQAHAKLALATARIETHTDLFEPWRLAHTLFVAAESMKSASRDMEGVRESLTKAAGVPQERP